MKTLITVKWCVCCLLTAAMRELRIAKAKLPFPWRNRVVRSVRLIFCKRLSRSLGD